MSDNIQRSKKLLFVSFKTQEQAMQANDTGMLLPSDDVRDCYLM